MGNYLNVPSDAERNYQQRIVDSTGRAGPTLQRIADLDKTHKNNTGMLQSLFEAVAPLSMYSSDAEGAYIPSKAMRDAQGLAKVFQDWYKTGTPTINVPFDKWSEILKSGKFKNQMELAGKNVPEAWSKRIEVEKNLGGFPYPKTMKKLEAGKLSDEDLFELKNIEKNLDWAKIGSTHMSPGFKLQLLNEYLKRQRELIGKQKETRFVPEYSESLAKQNPVYGHIYNPKYNNDWDATGFGNTHAEMSDLVKERSKYVLGDSFDPFVEKAFSSQDMAGETSALERSLFNPKRQEWTTDALKASPRNAVNYMEMWVPNELARINNIKSVHVPKKASYGEFDQAVPARDLPNLLEQKSQNFNNMQDLIPAYLKDSISPEDIIEGWPDFTF